MEADPVRFKKDEYGAVTIVGTVVSRGGDGGTGPVAVFTLPDGYRPDSEHNFHVQAENGPTVLTVKPDGSLLADPTAGWVKIRGVSFLAAGSG